MPCSSGMDVPQIVYQPGVDPRYRDEVLQLKAELDNVTALLCAAGRARKHKTDIPPEVLNWWDRHCHVDAVRGEPW
jgi:hypothetical protein